MRRLTKLIIGVVAAVIVLVVAAVALFILTRDEAPEAVDLETTVARIEAADAAVEDAEQPSATESTDDSADEPSATEPAQDGEDADTRSGTGDDDASTAGAYGTAVDDNETGVDTGDTGTETAAADETDETVDSPSGLAGVWTVQVAENPGDLQGEPTVSFAGFRVDEVLNNIGDFTAVGRTARVSGSIELSDTSLVAATVEVQMGTLQTDSSFRDGRIYQALSTSEFPLAVFTLVQPVELPAGMAGGEPFSGSAVGDLTIKGVTNRATFDLQAQLVGDLIVAVGSSDVLFSDYGVTAPTAPIVVSVEDHGIMEFQLLFTR